MNELSNLINKYFSKDIRHECFYNIDDRLITKVISELVQYDKPDILSIYDNKIIGIECFEFDSFKSNKKGSYLKKAEKNIREDLKRKIIEKKQQKENPIKLKEEIEDTISLNNYYNNFEYNFKEHYNKIQSYIDHIKEYPDYKGQEIHICFFAEDTTLLGNFYLDKKDNTKPQLLLPIHSKHIRHLLENSPLVEYIILGCFSEPNNQLVIIHNTREVLDRFGKEHEEISEDDFNSFKQQSVTWVCNKQEKEPTVSYTIRINKK